MGTYDTRAFGDFGWSFVNAGEEYRKLKGVPEEAKFMMVGLFKQATMGDCECAEARLDDDRFVIENKQREEWLKHKGVDTFVAMQMYIEKAKELAQLYGDASIEEIDE